MMEFYSKFTKQSKDENFLRATKTFTAEAAESAENYFGIACS